MFKVSKVSKAVTPPRWYARWRSERPLANGTDPADLGTAFGLDLSMMQAAPEPALSERRPGWVRRLTTRHRKAT